MKQKKIGDILYVYSTTAYEITEDTDATVIKIQEECIPAYAALNASLVSKFSPINYKLFCVVKPEWADYMNDYTVTVRRALHGTAIATPNGGDEGEEITLTITPDTGYELVELQVKDDDLNDIEVTDNKFLMPASNVIVNTVFDMIDFAITVDDQIQNGSLSAPASANLGDTVTVTATPASGYKLDTLTVMCGSLEITVVNNQFTMPAGDVTVTGTFVQAVDPYEQQYFTIESLEDGNTLTLLSDVGGSYSTDDGTTWNTNSSGATINLDTGDKVMFKGLNNTYGQASPDSLNDPIFGTTKTVDVYGNIMSLINGDNFVGETILPSPTYKDQGTFQGLFWGCKVVDASNLKLPATNLMTNCYNNMFYECTSLTSAPSLLPATTLTSSCYRGMFYNCTALTTAPELPATTLAYNCYCGMFEGCTSLETAPVLPATTLASMCYESMFQNCSSLTTAPELPATTLATYCYNGMFQGCTSLAAAPTLPATTSATGCYCDMFYGCTYINSVTMLLEDIPNASGSEGPAFLMNWIAGCDNIGTLYVSSNLTNSQRTMVSYSCPGGMDTQWTIEDYVPAS